MAVGLVLPGAWARRFAVISRTRLFLATLRSRRASALVMILADPTWTDLRQSAEGRCCWLLLGRPADQHAISPTKLPKTDERAFHFAKSGDLGPAISSAHPQRERGTSGPRRTDYGARRRLLAPAKKKTTRNLLKKGGWGRDNLRSGGSFFRSGGGGGAESESEGVFEYAELPTIQSCRFS